MIISTSPALTYLLVFIAVNYFLFILSDHVMKIKGGRNHLDIRKKGCIQKEEVVQEVETEVEVVPETEDGTEVTLKVEAAQREGGLILVEKRVPPGEVAPEQE